MEHNRIRYQTGSLTIEERKSGPAVWVYRWRETTAKGIRIKRKRIVGTTKEYPTKTLAKRAVDGMTLEINSATAAVGPLSLAQVVAHYRLTELGQEGKKTPRTKEVYEDQLARLILPQWGGCRLGEIKAVAVEAWLKSLPHAPATKTKTRNVLGILFQHAMRHEWATSNPIRLVRQSAKRLREPDILTVEEITLLLSELVEPAKTIVLAVAVTGLRRGELFGLKWQDVDFEDRQLKIVRSVVDQIEGPPKTIGSRKPLPLSDELCSALLSWRRQSDFSAPEDWVFASPQALGRKPYWPSAILTRHVLPAAKRAGIQKRIGWHTFRRTLATLLQSAGASVKTTQELLRHSSPTMTLGTYAQAVTADKREAQNSIAAMFSTPLKAA